MPQYIEKTRGFPLHQMPARNQLGRCRPTDEQISGRQYLQSYHWDKPAQPPGQTDHCPAKNKTE
jgi:hypothetical protein